MIHFFGLPQENIFAVETEKSLSTEEKQKLQWLFGDLPIIDPKNLTGSFFGPRATMITPWSTNAVEITQNMGVQGISRIEKYTPEAKTDAIDYMLVQNFKTLDDHIFKTEITPEKVNLIDNIAEFNDSEGLALSEEEVDYLDALSKQLNRRL